MNSAITCRIKPNAHKGLGLKMLGINLCIKISCQDFCRKHGSETTDKRVVVKLFQLFSKTRFQFIKYFKKVKLILLFHRKKNKSL